MLTIIEFKLHQEFTIGNFRTREWDEQGVILKTKKNKDPSLPKKKRNAIELEPKTYITGPHCNRALPEGVKFKENKAIEEPNYKMMALPDKSPANKKYVKLMDKMIQEGPDKHILLAKTSKLELIWIKPEE
ncbi:hypothetical protein Tco_1333668 [Tanacetum coccineum]